MEHQIFIGAVWSNRISRDAKKKVWVEKCQFIWILDWMKQKCGEFTCTFGKLFLLWMGEWARVLRAAILALRTFLTGHLRQLKMALIHLDASPSLYQNKCLHPQINSPPKAYSNKMVALTYLKRFGHIIFELTWWTYFRIAFLRDIFCDCSQGEILTCTSIPLKRDQKVPLEIKMMGVGILKDSVLIACEWMDDGEVNNFGGQWSLLLLWVWSLP